ncbi:unnamed protein product [Didymodactylos carnosus]|uniref:Uncharacterized protein n=1 Tax=Didymodactylos carnosus TaxID=1234261 RepID=A0A814U9J0_9BILA|nr:unnamed protein product [Didymodactylos carnosus]CAF1171397.1 unnamed protein product [Didymodactylos carnosus]CAF3744639.1 unnamed protein product [Didymodactylos carnosus]CAF3935277.1 unnamed protein product [Didymodactylos carnosus]
MTTTNEFDLSYETYSDHNETYIDNSDKSYEYNAEKNNKCSYYSILNVNKLNPLSYNHEETLIINQNKKETLSSVSKTSSNDDTCTLNDNPVLYVSSINSTLNVPEHYQSSATKVIQQNNNNNHITSPFDCPSLPQCSASSSSLTDHQTKLLTKTPSVLSVQSTGSLNQHIMNENSGRYHDHQQQPKNTKPLEKTTTNNKQYLKYNTNDSRNRTSPIQMRVVHIDGEFVVRI